MQPNHLPAQHTVIISPEQKPGFWVLCFNKSAHVSARVRVCVCESAWTKKITETGGFWH